MGECNYFFKAMFATADEAVAAERKLRIFLTQTKKAEKFYHYHNELPACQRKKELFVAEFWAEFGRQFPLVTDYIKFVGKWGGELHDLSGLLDLGDPEEIGLDIRTGTHDRAPLNILGHYGIGVWHFADWEPFTKYFIEKFKPLKAVWGNEEEDCPSMDALQLYPWEDIILKILGQRHLLPLLMHIDKDLDTLIGQQLKG
jgi:hypothetical protein